MTKQVSNLPSLNGRIRAPMARNEGAVKVSFCVVIRNENFDFDVLRTNLLLMDNDATLAEFLLFISPRLLNNSVKKLMDEFPDTLRVLEYDQGLSVLEIRNQQAQVAKGEVLFFANPMNKLGLNPSAFVSNQLNRSPREEMIIVQRPLRNITQMGVLRNTFFELGGFDERIAYPKQIFNLMKRLKKYGVAQLNVKLDEAAWVGSLNFAFVLSGCRTMKTEMSPPTDLIKPAK
jgi:hypothetical protein